MKLNKVIAIPAIALTAGISLAACGGSAAPTSQTVQQWWGSFSPGFNRYRNRLNLALKATRQIELDVCLCDLPGAG